MKELIKRHRIELLLYASFVLVHLILMQAADMPLMYGDERGYIGWARKLLYGTSDGIRYLPGYSLFLLPVLGICNDISLAYPWILAVNGLIGGFLPVAVYRLAGLMGGLNQKNRILCAGVCALYPAYLLYANMALCEILLATLFALLLLQCGLLAHHPENKWGWIRLGLLAVGLAMTHTRALIVFPALAVSIPILVKREQRKRVMISLGVLAVIGALLGSYFLIADNTNSVHLRQQLAGLATARGCKDFLYAVLSQGSYLLCSTFFTAAAGIWYGLRLILKRERGWQCAWCVLACWAGVFLLSALYMSHHEKPVHIIYGRYNDCMTAGLLFLGLTALLKREKFPKWLLLPCLLAVGVTGWKQAPLLANGQAGAELARLASGSVDSEVAQVFGIGLYRMVLERFDYWQTLLLFAGLTVLILAVCRRSRGLGAGVIGGLFFLSICYTDVTYFACWSESRNTPSEVMRVLTGTEQVKVVEQEENGLGYAWDYDKYMTYHPELTIRVEEQGQDLLLTRQNNYDMPLLAVEQDVNIYLWARTPEAALAYESWVIGTGREEVLLSLSAQGKVELKNLGAPLLCYRAARNIRECAAVLAVWYDEQGAFIRSDRLELPANLYQGEQAAWQLNPPQGAKRVYLAAAKEYTSWLPGGKMYEIDVKKGRIISVTESNETLDETTASFRRIELSHMKESPVLKNTTWNNNLTGFYGHLAGFESIITNVSCPAPQGGTMAVYASQGEPLWAEINGVSVGQALWENGCYRFSLNSITGTVTQITLRYPAAGQWKQSNIKLLNRWYQSRYQGLAVTMITME